MKVKKNLILVLGTLLLIIVFINNKSYAVLQSNGGIVATKDVGSWITQIRNMEAIGGGLGLTETINGKLISTTQANNLDCHMEKNTEFGAMAILSASSYGNPEKIANGGTTTGNNSGVVINISKEWVAAGTLSECPAYANAGNRYKNLYTANYSRKLGDAITETAGWHSTQASTNWLMDDTRYYGLIRADIGSIFSYNGNGLNYGGNKGDGSYYLCNWASRAVIVIGQGF